MITITRGLVAGEVLAGAAVGLAGPASAEPLSGDYTAIMIDAGASHKMVGSTTIFTLTPCGPDCTHVDTGGDGWDLHQQGNTWTGSNADSTQTLDNSSLISSLILTIQYADNPNVVIGLTKNG